MHIARQRFGKGIPAKQTFNNGGHPLLGNGLVDDRSGQQ
jgi:hypothetical protein